MPRLEHTDVLIVGAGPSGLVTALCLDAAGVRCTLVERRQGLGEHPKAHEINARTLEILDALGVQRGPLEDAAAPPEDGARIRFCRALQEEFGGIDLLDADCAARYAEHVRAGVPYLNLSQVELERVLREALAARPGIRFIEGASWQSQSGGFSRIRLESSGETLVMRHRFLVAADGATSRIRTKLRIPMEGPETLQRFVSCAFDADLNGWVQTRAKLYWILHPAAAGTLIAHHVERCWVYHVPFEAGTEREDYDEAFFRHRLQIALGEGHPEIRIRSISPWSMSAQVAERFREGDTFLVGDAAHRLPPTGGLGLNTGVADAHNLAWKLAAVIKGEATEDLLDTYERERRPVAEHNCAESHANFERLTGLLVALGLPKNGLEIRDRVREWLRAAPPVRDVVLGWMDRSAHERVGRALQDGEVRDRVTASIRDQLPHFDRLGLDIGYVYGGTRPAVREYEPRMSVGARLPHAWLDTAHHRSTHDLLRANAFTLLVQQGSHWPKTVHHARLRPPLQVVALDRRVPATRAFLELAQIGPSDALLVRPDGHVAWRGAAPDQPVHALQEAFRQCHFASA